MILKSFELEKNIASILNYKFILIYGENTGLKKTLKKKIISQNKTADIINIYQDDILKNKDIITDEVKNVSLFKKEKLIILNQVNEKIFSEIEDLMNGKEDTKIIIFADMLDKRSKLRNLFERQSTLAIIPCYNDSDITLRNLIQKELKDFKNLNSDQINKILSYSSLDRKTILNNLEKIKTFYDKKILSDDTLEILLNSDRNEIFENIRDAALDGDKSKLNDLFGNFAFSKEDSYKYLSIINFRLTKLLEIHNNNTSNNFEITITKMKPPIFWKDKPIYLKLLKKWHKQRVINALNYLGKIESKIKTNSTINSLSMIKNSITNICATSWSYF